MVNVHLYLSLHEVILFSDIVALNFIPTRWSAPETLGGGKFTYKSDVWMFGMLLYEIFTHGCWPFTELYSNSTEDIMMKVFYECKYILIERT